MNTTAPAVPPHRHTRHTRDGYALGLTLSAALLVAAVIVALAVLRRTGPPSRVEKTDDRALFPARD